MTKSPGLEGNRILKGLFLVFCCWHAIFLMISVWREPPPGKGHPVMNFYRTFFGGRQYWSLFETIPVHSSLDFRMVGIDSSGKSVTSGCVLPGLEDYPSPENIRYHLVFTRLLYTQENAPYRDAYFRRASQLLRQQHPHAVAEKWAMLIDAKFTRHLFHIRRDGQFTMPVRKEFPLSGSEPASF